MKPKPFILISMLLSVSVSVASSAEFSIWDDKADLPNGYEGAKLLPQDELKSISSPDVQYICNDFSRAPAGWVVTGRGSLDCHSAGSGWYDSFKFEPAKHDQLICALGPKAPAKFYVTDILRDFGTCGNEANTIHFKHKIRNSNYVMMPVVIYVCSNSNLPNYYSNMNLPHEISPHRDWVITERNIGSCYRDIYSEIGKNKVKKILSSQSPYPGAKIMRVCSGQALPSYVEVLSDTYTRASQCDSSIYDNSGTSVQIRINYRSICNGPYFHTIAKYLCGYYEGIPPFTNPK